MTTEQNTSQGKMEIKDLRYIVMEGGGARGATYLGAIRELENQLSNRIATKPSEKKASVSGRTHGVMDFLSIVSEGEGDTEDKTKPIIEGVAGASAGAITTFALVLGLNSSEIETVLNYPFKNFLSEVDAGKYRMIDESSQLAVGEDDKIDKAIEHATLRFGRGKGLGLKNDPFLYDLKKDHTKIIGNGTKYVIRELTLGTIFKIALDGITTNIGQLMRLFSGNSKKNWYQKLMKFLFGNPQGSVAKQTALAFASKAVYTSVMTAGIYSFFNIKSGDIKVNANSIMGIFKDRGMFSGFQVREFFFDLMIFAATKDTYFQKQLILFFNNQENKAKYVSAPSQLFQLKLKKSDFECTKKTDFKIGERSKYTFSKKFELLLQHLQDLTFREFYNIMGGVEYAAAVSNFSTNTPLYFSDKYTPNARVLEAVAASMSIPPAIRPIYNASDVLMESRSSNNDKNPSQLIAKEEILLLNGRGKSKMGPISVRVNDQLREFIKVDNQGSISFKRTDYELYEYAFKKGFQKYLLERSQGKNVYVDTNNLLEMNTFLDEMRKLLIGMRPGDSGEAISEWTDQLVMINGDKYEIKLDLMKFFYNAQFKGLLFDGGYFTNIPFNFFREKGNSNKIDGVLAIKLDRDFPPSYLNSLEQNISKFKVKVDDLIKQIEREELEEAFSVSGQKLTLESGEVIDLQAIYKFITLQFNLQIAQKSKKEIRLQKKTIRDIIKVWYKYYGSQNYLKPWETPRPVLDVAFTGYEYGSKRGQIRDLSDHNHIIPLYDYGIGTYDFDMGKIETLVDLAQYNAELAVKEFFKTS